MEYIKKIWNGQVKDIILMVIQNMKSKMVMENIKNLIVMEFQYSKVKLRMEINVVMDKKSMVIYFILKDYF